MESRSLKTISLLFLAFLCHNWFRGINSEIVKCDSNETCGYNSLCSNKECVCNDGFQSLVEPVGAKGKNCIDTKCENGKCYSCLDGTRCKRCIENHYITEGTGKCTDKCDTGFFWMKNAEYEGDVCKAPKSTFTEAQKIGLIVGLCLAAVLVIVVGIVIYIIRRKRSDEDTNRKIEEIKARKKKEKQERRRARNAAKNGNAAEGKQGDMPDVAGKESSENVLGAKDFEV